MLDFLGLEISINDDSSSVAISVHKLFRGLYERWLRIYKSVPAAEDSVGKNSWL